MTVLLSIAEVVAWCSYAWAISCFILGWTKAGLIPPESVLASIAADYWAAVRPLYLPAVCGIFAVHVVAGRVDDDTVFQALMMLLTWWGGRNAGDDHDDERRKRRRRPATSVVQSLGRRLVVVAALPARP